MGKKSSGLVFGILCLGVAVSAQAAAITLSPYRNDQKTLDWQNIVGTTYTFSDANSNNLVDVGEAVSFTVEMNKANWGTHDYDALKFWIYTPGNDLFTGRGIWDFDVTDFNKTQSWSGKDWEGGTKSFTFDYTFSGVGVFNIAASVMCSADLSGLAPSGSWDDPNEADWNAWTRNAHNIPPWKWRQGETEFYRLNVYESPAVPEPGTLALFLLGFMGLAGTRYFRKK